MQWPSLLSAFAPAQRRSIAWYILGIMCYKFGIEYFQGAFLALANERFGSNRYEKIGMLTGLNYAAQGVGSIAISPLIKHMPIRVILAAAVVAFGVVSAIIMVMDAATGGQIKFRTENNTTAYGEWHPNLMYPVFTIAGMSYGMIELIRRVVPTDIVGGDPTRLKKMDGLVHVMYESAGTIGALTSTSLIEKFGYNYSAFLSPFLFVAAAVCWWSIDIYSPNPDALMNERIEFEGKRASPTASLERVTIDRTRYTSLMAAWTKALRSFAKAFYYGGWLCITHRRFIWLIPSYTLALYGHRYLEYGIVQIFSKSVLDNSGLAQVIVGGSNLGELLGALCVMLSTQAIPTPIPWLRLDALLMNLIWVIPNFPTEEHESARKAAWLLAPCMIPISFGWAGGDCSLSAYIQSTLSKLEDDDDDVSALGAVMAFLYVTYIIVYSSISTALGGWVDRQLAGKTGADLVASARFALRMVGGVHFTLLGAVILLATFIPRNAASLNPQDLDATREKDHQESETRPDRDVDVMHRLEGWYQRAHQADKEVVL